MCNAAPCLSVPIKRRLSLLFACLSVSLCIYGLCTSKSYPVYQCPSVCLCSLSFHAYNVMGAFLCLSLSVSLPIKKAHDISCYAVNVTIGSSANHPPTPQPPTLAPCSSLSFASVSTLLESTACGDLPPGSFENKAAD